MSRGELVTIDFMGLDKGKEKCVHDLSWIKPKMMQQVLSLNKEFDKGLSSLPNCSRSVPEKQSLSATGTVTANATATAQLTIFYNGTMNVYDVCAEKAKLIFMLASGESSCKQLPNEEQEAEQKISNPAPVMEQEQGQFQKLHTDLPIARKQSLQRFLQKRKDRMKMAAPYSEKEQ